MQVKSIIFLIISMILAIEVAKAQYPVPDDISIEPLAIFNDGISKCTIKFNTGVQSPNTISIKFLSDNNIYFTASGFNSPQTTFPLFDDGTHGDEVANDHIFSIGGISSVFQIKRLSGIEWVNFELTIDGTLHPTKHFMSLPVVQKEQFNVRLVDNNTICSDYAVHFFNLNLADREDTKKVIHRFYDLFPDSYDFILLYRDRISRTTAYYLGVRNNVKGIGLQLFDESGGWGSGGQLQGIISIETEGQRTPFPEFVLMHEFGHRWGSFYTNPLLPLSTNLSHWNASSTIAGVMGPCCNNSFRYNGDGTFTHFRYYNDWRFEPIELYTMGGIPINVLDTCKLYVLKDPNIDQVFNGNIPEGSIITPKEYVKLTSDTIEKIYGKRVPDSKSSQKNYRTATIILTESKPAEEEICIWNKILRHFSAPYNENDPEMVDYYNWHGTPSFANYCSGLLSNNFLINTNITGISNKMVEENENLKCKVYPNPANDIITVEMFISRTYTIGISSIDGQLVYQTRIDENSCQIDLSSFNSGVYIISVKSEGFVATKKIIKL